MSLPSRFTPEHDNEQLIKPEKKNPIQKWRHPPSALRQPFGPRFSRRRRSDFPVAATDFTQRKHKEHLETQLFTPAFCCSASSSLGRGWVGGGGNERQKGRSGEEAELWRMTGGVLFVGSPWLPEAAAAICSICGGARPRWRDFAGGPWRPDLPGSSPFCDL